MQAWWTAVAKYPATWAAIIAIVVAEWAFFTLLDPPTPLGVIALVVGTIAIVAWPLTMSATGTLAKLQFEVPEVEEVSADELRTLERELNALDDPRPAQQLDAVREKRANLEVILERRLDAGELTYARYLTSTQQVYRAALDNLHEVVVAARSISAIDENYISSRLTELEDGQDDASNRERQSLTDRQKLLDTQAGKIAELLAQNESGMTAIDRTTTALANAPIGRAPEDAEAAMEALEELAERASKYASG